MKWSSDGVEVEVSSLQMGSDRTDIKAWVERKRDKKRFSTPLDVAYRWSAYELM
jgi:hypothetical protein